MGEAKRRDDFMAARGATKMPNGQIQVNVNLENTPRQKCGCGDEFFVEVFEVRVISALESPTGKELPIKIPHFACSTCGAVMGEKGDPSKDEG